MFDCSTAFSQRETMGSNMEDYELSINPLQSVQVDNDNRGQSMAGVATITASTDPRPTSSSRGSHQPSADNSTEISNYSPISLPGASQVGPLPPGYPTLAARMSLIPEVAIFRRFGSANAQNLLYMQAEILHMENTLRSYQIRDSNSQDHRTAWHVADWWHMAHAHEQDRNDEQWKLVQDIRQKLKEYST